MCHWPLLRILIGSPVALAAPIIGCATMEDVGKVVAADTELDMRAVTHGLACMPTGTAGVQA